MHTILVVSNNTDKRMLLTSFLTGKNYVVSGRENGHATMQWLKRNKPDLVLCDLKIADITSMQLLGKIKEKQPNAIVIFTGENYAEGATEVLQSGAYAYIAEPLLPDKISHTIKEALSPQLKEITIPVTTKCKTKDTAKQAGDYCNEYITGNSIELTEIARQVELVAPTNFSVIIYGQSGSGKEVIAQQIHRKSKRADKPFVAIDCGALTKELSGSEFFGHEKGSFTGAFDQKIGSLESANGGTIFLDEIGNLPYEIQVSLLRTVQERKIRRVGGNKNIDIDVRIIVASNVNLCEAARAGKFREDLYHRFNEFTIALPSLCERKQDIMLFAHHFLTQTNKELEKHVKGFNKEVEHILLNYVWHGNIRELKNVIKRSVLLTDGELVEVRSLPPEISSFLTQHIEPGNGIDLKANVDTQFSYMIKGLNNEYDVMPLKIPQAKKVASFV
ncbi:MAG: two component, sigma54 specific, transcriptional regulator, Fis family [Flavipsychrobacter sp.]|jgi:two-component system response regulator HydG|nr:two component, sigma54 specific, transcriptional regulator, Fis family [Flavipsychrobacter sp.]